MKNFSKVYLLVALAGLGACAKKEAVTPAPQAQENVSEAAAQPTCNSQIFPYLPMIKDASNTNYVNGQTYQITRFQTIRSAVPRRFYATVTYPLCVNMYHADFIRYYLRKPDGTEVFIGQIYPYVSQSYAVAFDIPLEYVSNDFYVTAKDAQVGQYAIKLEYGTGTYQPGNTSSYYYSSPSTYYGVVNFVDNSTSSM